MGVYHIVLFKLLPEYKTEVFDYWQSEVHKLVGVIPGLRYVDVSRPLPETADRTKGYDIALVAVLDEAKDALIYAHHPAHEKIIKEYQNHKTSQHSASIKHTVKKFKMGSTTRPTTVRWGIMATGSIAQTFAKDLMIDPKTRGETEVFHVVTGIASSSSSASARRFFENIVQSRQCSEIVCSTYGSYEELVQDSAIDIVYIATPHSHHYQNCMLVLKNGKSVLCEKPVAVNAAQARKLYEMAREKRLFFMEAVWTRFFPLSVTVRQFIRDGMIGDVVRVYVNNSTGTDVEVLDPSHRYLDKSLAGGALLDIGVYALTWLFQTLFHTQDSHSRQPPSALASLVEFHEPSGTDQMTSMIMRFGMPSNSLIKVAHGVATTSMILPDSTSEGGPTVHIYGLKGEIQVWGPAHRSQSIRIIPKNRKSYETKFEIPAGGHGMFWEADAAANSWHAGQLECPIMPWDESVLVMEAVDEIRRQANIVYPSDIETTDYPVELKSRN